MIYLKELKSIIDAIANMSTRPAAVIRLWWGRLRSVERTERTTRAIDLAGHEITFRLLKLCDPRCKLETDRDFVLLWREIQQCIRGIKEELNSFHPLPLWADRGVPSRLAALPFSPSVVS